MAFAPIVLKCCTQSFRGWNKGILLKVYVETRSDDMKTAVFYQHPLGGQKW